ncbi:MAG: serine hydrolase, partial [Gammaproteobacteria bacterium]
WMECNSATYNCDPADRVSSPGAYGAYPFIDFSSGVYGIIARQGALGTFAEGYQVFSSVVTEIESWAELQNSR